MHRRAGDRRTLALTGGVVGVGVFGLFAVVDVGFPTGTRVLCAVAAVFAAVGTVALLAPARRPPGPLWVAAVALLAVVPAVLVLIDALVSASSGFVVVVAGVAGVVALAVGLLHRGSRSRV